MLYFDEYNETFSEEDDIMSKNVDYDIALWFSTKIRTGNCRMLVICVGLSTKVGSIMGMLGARPH